MAYMNTTSTYASLVERMQATTSRLVEALNTYAVRRRVYRQTYSELASLSNRELADLGIARASIRRLALEAADLAQ